MFRFLLILLLFITVSCNSGYMVLTGKDGKKTVFKRQTPEFNKKYIERQRRNNNARRLEEISSVEKVENKESKRVVDSTAYTSKSVLDNNTVVEEVVKKNKELTKSINEESKRKTKTIEDFDYLPDSVFADPVIVHKNEIVNDKVSAVETPKKGNVKIEEDTKKVDNDNSSKAKSKIEDKKVTDKPVNELVVADAKVEDKKVKAKKKIKENKEIKVDKEVKIGDKTAILEKDQKDQKNEVLDDRKLSKDSNKDSNLKTASVTTPIIVEENKDVEANANLKKDKDIDTKNEKGVNNQDKEKEEKQGVKEEKNVDSIDVSNDTKLDDIEVVGVSKKKSWWKFWGKDKEDVTDVNKSPSFKHDSENDVPREENVVQEDIENNNNIDSDVEKNSDVTKSEGKDSDFEARRIDEKQYKKELLDNNKFLNKTAGLKSGKFYVQIISVKNENNCRKILKKYDTNNKGIIYPVNLDGTMYYRGVIGPFDTFTEAEIEKTKIINMGHYDIFTFKEK